MPQISTNELPKNLQKLFIEVQQTQIPLTVFHEGKPLVIISPATTQPRRATGQTKRATKRIHFWKMYDWELRNRYTPYTYSRRISIDLPKVHTPRATFGAMKGSGEILGDLIDPAVPLNTWEVLQ
jgi:hypothetical protein